MAFGAVNQKLSADQLATWDEKGYLVIDDPCPSDLVDAVAAEVEPLYHDENHPGDQYAENGVIFNRHPGQDDGYRWHRIKDAWNTCDSVRTLALSPRVLAATEELFGRRVLPFQTLNFPMGTQQPPHFDSLAFQSHPPGFMCGVWVALEDMDMTNGPLQYYPGSHKLDAPTWKVIEETTNQYLSENDCASRPEYRAARSRQCDRYCRLLIEEHGFEPEYATIRKGQALVWSPNLIHGGAVQTDKSKTRNSQVTHYFFEGCRYYGPMYSEPDHIVWEYPTWIREPPPARTNDEIREAIESSVSPGASVLIAGGDPALMAIADRQVRPFPQQPDADPIRHLGDLAEGGAEYLVVPRSMFGWLQWDSQALQTHLEEECAPVLTDGATAVVYAL